MNDTILVLIADDHPLVRGGLKAAFNGAGGIEVVGEAENGLKAEEVAVRCQPDVVIMDIYMPGRDGIESMIAIKQKLPDVKVLLLTFSEKEEDLIRAIRVGADGYLLKSTPVEEVVPAVKQIVAGEVVMSPLIASKLAKGLRANTGPVLSRREEEVLSLVGEGLTNAEIGKHLFLSPNTINSYIQRLLDKLALKNRAAAIAYATRHLNTKSH